MTLLSVWGGTILLLASTDALAGGKVGLYAVRMMPYGIDAESYSRPGWGGGLQAVVPVKSLSDLVAGNAGLEIVNLLSETEAFRDQVTGLRVEQQTDQNLYRFYLGGQFVGHGKEFVRPHAGADIALIYYEISTDVVVPNDYNREQEIRQKLKSNGDFVFGYDLSIGVDLNFSNKFSIDGGVKYLHSFGVPQQLGEGSVKIFPRYTQIYLGVGIPFDVLKDSGDNDD